MEEQLDILIVQHKEYLEKIEDLLTIVVKQNAEGNPNDNLDNLLLNGDKVNKELNKSLKDGFKGLQGNLEKLQTRTEIKNTDYSKLLASMNRKSKRVFDTLQLIKGQDKEKLGAILTEISKKTTELVKKEGLSDKNILIGLKDIAKKVQEINIPELEFEFDYDRLQKMQSETVETLIKNVFKVDLDKYKGKEEALAVKIYDKDGFVVNSFGGGGTTGSVHLKNDSDAAINPATEDKQDDIITGVSGLLTDTELRATPVPVSMDSDIEIGAVEIKNADTDDRVKVDTNGNLSVIAGLEIPAHDYVGVTYVASGDGANEPEVVTYKTGGSGGTTVATLTLTYNSINEVATVTKT